MDFGPMWSAGVVYPNPVPTSSLLVVAQVAA